MTCLKCGGPMTARNSWCPDCVQKAKIRGYKELAKPLPKRNYYRGADWDAYLQAVESELMLRRK